MKGNKRYLFVAIALLLATLFVCGLAMAEEKATITGIKFTKTAYEFELPYTPVDSYKFGTDGDADIGFTIEPAEGVDLDDYVFRFTTSNRKVSYVDNTYGYLYATDVGSTEITVKAVNRITGKIVATSDKATVTFKEVPVKEITLNNAKYDDPVEVLLEDPDIDNLNDCTVVTPENATYSYSGYLSWSTTDTSIIRLSKNGDLTPLKVGEATVKVISKGANPISFQFKVKVTTEPYTGVSFTPNSFTQKKYDDLRIGKYVNVVPDILYLGGLNYEKVTWSSSDKSIAFVDYDPDDYESTDPDGWVLKAEKSGTATITMTITNYDGSTVSGDFTATVEEEGITSLKFAKSEYTQKVGEGKDLENELIVKPDDLKFKYEDVEDYDLLWSSSDETVAKINEFGYVEAKGLGTATITVKCKHDESIKAETKIKVTDVTIDKVKLPATLELSTATTTSKKITFTYEPSNAYVKEVTWTTSNPLIATVSKNESSYYDYEEERYVYGAAYNGEGSADITVQKAGTVIITVKVDDGVSVHEASCIVTITEQAAETLKIDPKAVTLYLHRNMADNRNVKILEAYDMNKGKKANYDDEDVIWKSNKTKVVSINRRGELTVHGKGKATITATLKDGTGLTAKCVVTVKKLKIESISGNKRITMRVGDEKELYQRYDEALTITPDRSKVYDDRLIFTSSNNKIVSVNKTTGRLCANGVGTATITVKVKDGNASFKFKVKVIDAMQ